jgi:alditol oxidase
VRNWAGNVSFAPEQLVIPRSLDELCSAIASARHVKVIGSRHSFNDIANTTDTMVSMEQFVEIGEPDAIEWTVTVGGGVTYGQLASHLQSRGWALHNLASLPHITVAGACATATHGSGMRNGNLAAAVVALRLVRADGSTAVVVAGDDDFDWMVVGLGAFGIVAELTLRIEPTYDVTQWVYEGVPLQRIASLRDAGELAYSVSLFTRWTSGAFDQVWVKDRVGGPFPGGALLFGASLAAVNVHPVAGVSAEGCTDQVGTTGAWCDRLPHFKMAHTPSAGDELQSEYFVPAEYADAAARQLTNLGAVLAPVLLASEVRFVAADRFPMSSAFARSTVAFNFTWRRDWESVRPVLVAIEAALESFDARPHWGKLFAMSAERLRSVYPNSVEFADRVERHDPGGKFSNAFLNRYGLAAS